VSAWKDEMNRITNDGITADELKDAKSGFLQSRATARANDAGLASALSSNLFYGRTMAHSQEIDDKIAALTVDQVNAAIKKYFNADKAITIKAGDFK
jgi:zinc protease